MTWVDESEDRQSVVTSDGVTLSATATGGGRPAVLWLHGGPGMFDYLAPATTSLSLGTHVRFDQRGCGRSERRGPFTIQRALQDVEDVRRFYGLDSPVIAGHSFGATLALLYALANPDGVAGVLYISGTGLGAAWRDAHHCEHDRRLAPAQRRRRKELRQRADRWTWHEEVEYRRLSYLPDVANREEASNLVEPLAAAPWRLNLETNAMLGRESKRSLDESELARRCGGLHVSVMVVHGVEDPHPVSATDSLVAALPNARRVLLAASGHLPFVERPDVFRRVVDGFLGSLGGGQP